MAKSIEITDDLIVEHLARHPTGDDQFSDAANHPYTFLKGYRDAETGIDDPEDHYTIAQGSAYRLGQYEFKEG